ncbi:hypothetical protein N7495_001798 [Penicillium taxi]|uniref:uncharacterized protein n=1 Tax=Penicillium taxi TaxID=168475 RepID=UPI002545141D|nr:uncharacterized protein N7495_001798 [Penicillium taxi]KAJ5909116.1 hypothetical protein N7495_001798 [Penicillium taxi]
MQDSEPLSPKVLKRQRGSRGNVYPKNAHDHYIRVKVGGELARNIFAASWGYGGRDLWWITQLCVCSRFRRDSLVSKLLMILRQGEPEPGFVGFGIHSSHSPAILTVLRDFGRGVEEVFPRMTKEHAQAVVASSPVGYIRKACLPGSIFNFKNQGDGTVPCADAQFWWSMRNLWLRWKLFPRMVLCGHFMWPFGELPDGREFLW